jgi:hypothetical protein
MAESIEMAIEPELPSIATHSPHSTRPPQLPLSPQQLPHSALLPLPLAPRLALLLRVIVAAALLVTAFEGELYIPAIAADPALATAPHHLGTAHIAAASAKAANASARTDIALPSASHSAAAASISWDFIDKVVYINSAEATERNEAMWRDFLPALGKAPSDIIRLEAFAAGSDRPKVHGSGASHLAVLELAIAGGFHNVLVLEDDVLWRVSPRRANLLLLEELAGLAFFDVILLGGTFVVADVGSHRVEHSYSTSAYFVAGHYLQTLADNFAFSLASLEREPHRTKDFSIDVYWTVAMRRDAWFIIQPALAIQDHHATLFEPWGYGEVAPFVGD